MELKYLHLMLIKYFHYIFFENVYGSMKFKTEFSTITYKQWHIWDIFLKIKGHFSSESISGVKASIDNSNAPQVIPLHLVHTCEAYNLKF